MPIIINTIEEALKRLRSLNENNNQRIIIGIVGKPGAGKSTLTSYLLENLVKEKAVLVPMDGYHLSNKLLEEYKKADRKGAYDTFDARGYSELIKRIKSDSDSDIYFPIFHREIEESIVAEGVVLKDCKVVLTEGNYLLLDKNGWQDVKSLLTESWYIQVDDDLRRERLMARSIRYGRTPEIAYKWTHGSDEVNAKVVETTMNNADVVLIDTAGRLHNKVNLMNELTKVKRVMQKLIPDAPHEVLLVLDGSTGQNAIEQAKQFTKATEVTSLAITKLDGTAKGGVVIGISDQFKIPVKFIGVGEGIEDLQVFNKYEFVDSLFK